ncbi:MAG: flagellar operon protein [Solirubrobacterales bacterium]|nr:flagellar operon protein [Solirubrobacterales bacterium]
MSVPLHNPALVTPIGAPAPAGRDVRPGPVGSPSVPFADVMGKTDGVRFSSHAAQRLERRGIPMDPPTLQRLDDGVRRAAGKGSRDAVVLVDQTAFVVSVANKTVITAVDRQHMKDHVFTNIDSAVIA